MSPILSTHDISKSFGSKVLFDEINLSIFSGNRVGLIGPNGAGKSSFLKIIAGLEKPDSGFISKRQGLKIGYATQLPEFPDLPLLDVLVKDRENIQEVTEARIALSKAEFADIEMHASQLSGGWKKRLDIIKALKDKPDLLLLDEPTNHLDLEGILWLEKLLKRESTAFIVISHDRYFLESIAEKVVELNRCYPEGIFISDGGMQAFNEHKQAFLLGQLQKEKELKAIVKSETDWLRRSPKARTTKSISRIQRAEKLIDELEEVKKRNQMKRVELNFTASDRESRKLLVAKNISKEIEGRTLFKEIDLTLSPGARLGIVGKNGTGKTTLMKILSGEIKPTLGTIKYADQLKIVYFDQQRESIPLHYTLREALSPTTDLVNYRGQFIHVNSWAKKFLFSLDNLDMPIKHLSGGERARIIIAKLMLQEADVLFLDEPTNDLDIPTLEIMEESLKEFNGAVVLISHDRALMDNICTQIIGLGQNNEHQFFADYKQWERSLTPVATKKEPAPKKEKPLPAAKKLSYKEQQELNGMDAAIERTESSIVILQKQLEELTDAKQSLELYQKLSDQEKHLEELFARWQYLIDTE